MGLTFGENVINVYEMDSNMEEVYGHFQIRNVIQVNRNEVWAQRKKTWCQKYMKRMTMVGSHAMTTSKKWQQYSR